MAELTKQDIVEIISRVVDEKITPIIEDLAEVRAGMATMATKDDLAAVRADMATKEDLAAVRIQMATKEDLAKLEARLEAKCVTKEELTRVREILLAKFDRMEDVFKEDLAAQDARLTVRLGRHFEKALEVRDLKIMETMRQAAA